MTPYFICQWRYIGVLAAMGLTLEFVMAFHELNATAAIAASNAQ